jgi:hypothetical protein
MGSIKGRSRPSKAQGRKRPKGKGDKHDKARKLTKEGKLKKKRGDEKVVTARNVGFTVKQKKGGAWVKTGERQCKIHTKCDCVRKTDPAKLSKIFNR